VLWARGRRCRSSLSLYSHDSSACQAWRGGSLSPTPWKTTASGFPAANVAAGLEGAGRSVEVHLLLPGQQRRACCTRGACSGRSAARRQLAAAAEASSLAKTRASKRWWLLVLQKRWARVSTGCAGSDAYSCPPLWAGRPLKLDAGNASPPRE